eukprot:10318541-Heterocapsa_arctica.AAC.1
MVAAGAGHGTSGNRWNRTAQTLGIDLASIIGTDFGRTPVVTPKGSPTAAADAEGDPVGDAGNSIAPQ